MGIQVVEGGRIVPELPAPKKKKQPQHNYPPPRKGSK